MAYGILLGEDARVAAWAFATFKFVPTPINKGLGIIDGNCNLVGAILLQNFNGTNLELSYYGPWTVTLGIVRIMARTVIGEFNAARLTVVTSKKNRRLIWSLQKFGFKLEGAQRCYYGHEDIKRNVGVRLVLFRDGLERLAGRPLASSIKQG